MGLGHKWGHGAGAWGRFRGPAWWNETFRCHLGTRWDTGWVQGTSGDTGLGHGVGLGGQHRGMGNTWDTMGWV